MKKIFLFFVYVLCLVGLISLVSLGIKILENPKYSYASYAEIKNAELISRGWYPKYLPKSLSKFEGTHNIDTNNVFASFLYEVGDDQTVSTSCKIILSNENSKKYICPPYEKNTATIILNSNGNGYYLKYGNGI